MDESWWEQANLRVDTLTGAADDVRDKAARRSGRQALTHDGIRRLHLALLSGVLRDLTSPATVRRWQAWRWIEVDDEADHPLSFHAVCTYLGLSVSAVRRQLRKHGPDPLPRKLKSTRVTGAISPPTGRTHRRVNAPRTSI